MTVEFNHCIGLRFLSKEMLVAILKQTAEIKSRKQSIDLMNQVVVHLFFEPSTRTRLSFEIATQKCRAFPMMIDIKTSSLTKGESLLDMVKNIAAMDASALVVRHSDGGVPYFISEHSHSCYQCRGWIS